MLLTKKTLVRPSNTMHDTTVAVFEEKVRFNDNHRLETRVSPYAWCQGNDTLLCTMPTSVQRTAVWPVLRVPRLFAPCLRPRMLGHPLGNCLVLRISLRRSFLQNLIHHIYFLTVKIHSPLLTPGFAHHYSRLDKATLKIFCSKK